MRGKVFVASWLRSTTCDREVRGAARSKLGCSPNVFGRTFPGFLICPVLDLSMPNAILNGNSKLSAKPMAAICRHRVTSKGEHGDKTLRHLREIRLSPTSSVVADGLCRRRDLRLPPTFRNNLHTFSVHVPTRNRSLNSTKQLHDSFFPKGEVSQ